MTIKIGDAIPQAPLRHITADGAQMTTSKEFFAGKTVALFGLPGAFTGTCSNQHLPGFLAQEAALKAKGVDVIAMTAVNDHYVLAAWKRTTGADGHIEFLGDVDAAFAKAMGLEIDLSAGGLGLRSKRYAALVKDGVVKILNIEDSPGKAEISSAANLLKAI